MREGSVRFGGRAVEITFLPTAAKEHTYVIGEDGQTGERALSGGDDAQPPTGGIIWGRRGRPWSESLSPRRGRSCVRAIVYNVGQS